MNPLGNGDGNSLLRTVPRSLPTIYVCRLDTRNWNFSGAGLSRKEARAALGDALRIHALQASLPSGWWHGYDFTYDKYLPGKGLRDGEPMKEPKR